MKLFIIGFAIGLLSGGGGLLIWACIYGALHDPDFGR